MTWVRVHALPLHLCCMHRVEHNTYHASDMPPNSHVDFHYCNGNEKVTLTDTGADVMILTLVCMSEDVRVAICSGSEGRSLPVDQIAIWSL